MSNDTFVSSETKKINPVVVTLRFIAAAVFCGAMYLGYYALFAAPASVEPIFKVFALLFVVVLVAVSLAVASWAQAIRNVDG